MPATELVENTFRIPVETLSEQTLDQERLNIPPIEKFYEAVKQMLAWPRKKWYSSPPIGQSIGIYSLTPFNVTVDGAHRDVVGVIAAHVRQLEILCDRNLLWTAGVSSSRHSVYVLSPPFWRGRDILIGGEKPACTVEAAERLEQYKWDPEQVLLLKPNGRIVETGQIGELVLHVNRGQVIIADPLTQRRAYERVARTITG